MWSLHFSSISRSFLIDVSASFSQYLQYQWQLTNILESNLYSSSVIPGIHSKQNFSVKTWSHSLQTHAWCEVPSDFISFSFYCEGYLLLFLGVDEKSFLEAILDFLPCACVLATMRWINVIFVKTLFPTIRLISVDRLALTIISVNITIVVVLHLRAIWSLR